MDSVIKMVLDGNWVDLGKHVEAKAAEKIKAKVDVKKAEFINKMNAGYGTDDE